MSTSTRPVHRAPAPSSICTRCPAARRRRTRRASRPRSSTRAADAPPRRTVRVARPAGAEVHAQQDRGDDAAPWPSGAAKVVNSHHGREFPHAVVAPGRSGRRTGWRCAPGRRRLTVISVLLVAMKNSTSAATLSASGRPSGIVVGVAQHGVAAQADGARGRRHWRHDLKLAAMLALAQARRRQGRRCRGRSEERQQGLSQQCHQARWRDKQRVAGMGLDIGRRCG